MNQWQKIHLQMAVSQSSKFLSVLIAWWNVWDCSKVIAKPKKMYHLVKYTIETIKFALCIHNQMPPTNCHFNVKIKKKTDFSRNSKISDLFESVSFSLANRHSFLIDVNVSLRICQGLVFSHLAFKRSAVVLVSERRRQRSTARPSTTNGNLVTTSSTHAVWRVLPSRSMPTSYGRWRRDGTVGGQPTEESLANPGKIMILGIIVLTFVLHDEIVPIQKNKRMMSWW